MEEDVVLLSQQAHLTKVNLHPAFFSQVPVREVWRMEQGILNDIK